MENATKGLMIAGAILIAIVLIGIGVMLVEQGQNATGGATAQFEQFEVDQFNSAYESYEGSQRGSNVRTLLSNINSNNMKAATEGTLNETGISVFVEGIDNTDFAGLEVKGATDYDSSVLVSLRQDINTGKTYTVNLGYDNGTRLINTVTIVLETE